MSKGCAFITYAKRMSAQAAIRHMHQSITMEVSIELISMVFFVHNCLDPFSRGGSDLGFRAKAEDVEP